MHIQILYSLKIQLWKLQKKFLIQIENAKLTTLTCQTNEKFLIWHVKLKQILRYININTC